MNLFSFEMHPADPSVNSVERDVIGPPREYAPTIFSQLQDRPEELAVVDLSLKRLGKLQEWVLCAHKVPQHVR
jgi:hypothetical protein